MVILVPYVALPHFWWWSLPVFSLLTSLFNDYLFCSLQLKLGTAFLASIFCCFPQLWVCLLIIGHEFSLLYVFEHYIFVLCVCVCVCVHLCVFLAWFVTRVRSISCHFSSCSKIHVPPQTITFVSCLNDASYPYWLEWLWCTESNEWPSLF
jgi:hypothetical protein